MDSKLSILMLQASSARLPMVALTVTLSLKRYSSSDSLALTETLKALRP